LTTDQVARASGNIVFEEPVADGSVPRFELGTWRRYGVVAGVTGRGDPADPFDLGLATQQPIGRVLDRWRAVRSAVGFTGVVVARQVHGTNLLWHETVRGLSIRDQADGHATRTPGTLLAVSLADCIPIYLVDPVAKAVALLHSGWKGTAGRIVESGIRLLSEASGSVPSHVMVHCGVGICGRCYQVGSEVATACGRPAQGQSNLDLRSVIAEQAAGLGVADITVSGFCSAHDVDRFFSHRASSGADGRMIAYLGIPEP